MIKKLARSIVVAVLGSQTKRLIKRHHPTIIAVVGSIGKTSTKRAIAEVLSTKLRVQYQSGNYNDLTTVPLILFGKHMPALFNPFGWLNVFISNEIQLLRPYPYDVAIVEIGTDGPGQIAAFKRYLTVDLAVLTSIAPEHMEFFADLDAVAREELSIVQYSNKLLLNADLVAAEYRSLVPEAMTYALHNSADYRVKSFSFTSNGVRFELDKDEEPLIKGDHVSISEPHLYSLTAAVAVGDNLGMTADELRAGIEHIQPVSGRMQSLEGIDNSTIIDDTYNASPEAMKAALETLYRIDAPQKIALLGNMNELGDFSKQAHIEVGKLCDPQQISEVLTLGPDANEYLAAAAEQKGCKVTRFTSPYEAGQYLKSIIQPDAVVLAKGSQNKVFAEEAIKQILANPADISRLVRQDKSWMNIKEKQFKP
jgi:UDP-N-acetylmuramoyl-tripeptide--D-alanyl-D-alanine ligase